MKLRSSWEKKKEKMQILFSSGWSTSINVADSPNEKLKVAMQRIDFFLPWNLRNSKNSILEKLQEKSYLISFRYNIYSVLWLCAFILYYHAQIAVW